MAENNVYSELCGSSVDSITIRNRDLCTDLIGKVGFTEMFYFDVVGQLPTAQQREIVDAVLVTLMEHGLTPSAVAARMTWGGAPEAMQGAIAAGLLGGGSVLLGTLESCATLLARIVEAPEGIEAAARAEARAYRERGEAVPGFGHPYHKPDDPRTLRLFDLARSAGVSGRYIGACEALAREVDAAFGKHLTVNASAACGALLCEIGMPREIMRGFALVARAAGLVAHIQEEIRRPTVWTALRAVNEAVPFKQTAQSDLKD